METRTIHQAKVFFLYANDMRLSSIEDRVVFAAALTKELITKLIESQKVDDYVSENKWNKSYKEGGPLEWMNPINDMFGGGIIEKRIDIQDLDKIKTEVYYIGD